VEDWIRSLIAQGVRSVTGLAQATARRLTSVWSVITAFFVRVATAATTVRARILGLFAAMARHAAATLTTLRWIILTYVPRRLAQAAADLRTWTANLIRTTVNAVRALVDQLASWARARVAELLGALDALRRWALDRVALLADRVNRLLDRVFGLWATPSRLAAWLVGAMFGALLRFAVDNAVRVGRALWAARARVALDGLHLVEDIITRII
jgi:hypothetical protein